MLPKIYLYLFCIALIGVSCAKERVSDFPEAPNSKYQQIDLSQGISDYLPKDHLALYSREDLVIMDELARSREDLTLQLRAADIVIPAGSTDALQDAVDNANPGERIVLESGLHTESGPIRIEKRIRLEGEPGAILQFSNINAFFEFPALIEAGLHLKNAHQSIIKGLEIVSTDALPGTCIFLENSDQVQIVRNKLSNWQFSMVLQYANRARIYHNEIIVHPGALTGDLPDAEGVVIVNGNLVSVVNNTISNALLGIFTGGYGGTSLGNETFGCFYGQILCRVPPSLIVEEGADPVGADFSSTRWFVAHNYDHDNFAAGILVIDGAHNNLLISNKGANNAQYDIELAGLSIRFGFETPECFNNRVYTFKDMVVKDCGSDNKILGGILVDNSQDECF